MDQNTKLQILAEACSLSHRITVGPKSASEIADDAVVIFNKLATSFESQGADKSTRPPVEREGVVQEGVPDILLSSKE